MVKFTEEIHNRKLYFLCSAKTNNKTLEKVYAIYPLFSQKVPS